MAHRLKPGALRDTDATSTKRCSTCGTLRSLTDFYSDPSKRDGHKYQCCDCARAGVMRARAKRRRAAPKPACCVAGCLRPAFGQQHVCRNHLSGRMFGGRSHTQSPVAGNSAAAGKPPAHICPATGQPHSWVCGVAIEGFDPTWPATHVPLTIDDEYHLCRTCRQVKLVRL